MRALIVVLSALALVAAVATEAGHAGPPPPCCVQLAPQTKTANCELALIPDLACSPGWVLNSEPTGSICGLRSLPTRRIPAAVKREVGVAYGLPAGTRYGPTHSYEIVPVIPYILNGAGSWDLSGPYPVPSRDLAARVKLIRFLADRANCPPWKLSQQQAQHAMLDWAASYALVFGKQPPD